MAAKKELLVEIARDESSVRERAFKARRLLLPHWDKNAAATQRLNYGKALDTLSLAELKGFIRVRGGKTARNKPVLVSVAALLRGSAIIVDIGTSVTSPPGYDAFIASAAAAADDDDDAAADADETASESPAFVAPHAPHAPSALRATATPPSANAATPACALRASSARAAPSAQNVAT